MKISGGETIAIPTGNRARGDANIMSPTAVIQDKGSLSGKGNNLLMASASSGPGLAGGSGSGSAIALPSGGSRLAAPAAGGLPAREDKKLASKSLPNPLGEAAKPLTAAAIPTALPRRAPVQPRPMFLITGPLANRAVTHREIPAYPDWARAKGIEANVALQFTVTPEGQVKDNILVVRTSGYPQMDEIAVNALKKWTFAALPQDKWRDEVGTITFNFSVQ
jgi:TonB family protein